MVLVIVVVVVVVEVVVVVVGAAAAVAVALAATRTILRRVAFSQAFSGPGRPPKHFEYFGKFQYCQCKLKLLSNVTQVTLSKSSSSYVSQIKKVQVK